MLRKIYVMQNRIMLFFYVWNTYVIRLFLPYGTQIRSCMAEKQIVLDSSKCIFDPPQWFEGWCTSRLCWRGVASGWCRGWTWDSAGEGYSGPPYCTSHTETSSQPSNTRHSCPSERHTYTDSLWDTSGNQFLNEHCTILQYTTIWDWIWYEKKKRLL